MCGFVYAYNTDAKEVSDCDLKSFIRLYPQPVESILTVTKTTTCVVKLNVYNELGQLVINQAKIEFGDNKVSMRHLAAGVYLYELVSGNGRHTGKILKLWGHALACPTSNTFYFRA